MKLLASFVSVLLYVFSPYFSESYGSYVESCEARVTVLKVFSQDQTDIILKQNKDLSVGPKYVGMRVRVVSAKRLRRSHGGCGSMINKEFDIVASVDESKTVPVITAGEVLLLNYSFVSGLGPYGAVRHIQWTILGKNQGQNTAPSLGQ